MTIGIIGPQFSCEKIKKDLGVITPETNIILYTREASTDAILVIEKCEKECDAVIFTGRGPCTSVTSRYDIRIPFEYITKGGASLTKTFLDMQKVNIEIDNFSIDVAEPHVIEDVFNEMDINPVNIYSLPFDSYNENEYIQWHLDLWKNNKIKAILTGFVWIYDYFTKEGYPVFYLPTTRTIVRSTFEQLKKRIALEEAHYAQNAVEILRVMVASENEDNYYSYGIKKSKADGCIINYAQKLQASFFSLGRHEYLIFTNRGCAENEDNYLLLYTLQNEILDIGCQLNIGIGVSITAYQSEINARKALQHSIQSKENYIYIVNENNNLIGPLGREDTLKYELTSLNSEIKDISQRTEMSPSSIAKLISIIEVRRDSVFDIAQLADCLHIGVRSARRVANKLISSGYARVCAKESSAGGGRPKNLIEICFDVKSK